MAIKCALNVPKLLEQLGPENEKNSTKRDQNLMPAELCPPFPQDVC